MSTKNIPMDPSNKTHNIHNWLSSPKRIRITYLFFIMYYNTSSNICDKKKRRAKFWHIPNKNKDPFLFEYPPPTF